MMSACSAPAQQKPRVELPQQFRLPQNDMVTLFEPRVGRIAVTAEDGNILVMDQTGGDVVQLTRDGNRQGSESGQAQIYSLSVWSPDAKQLALIELTARRTSVSSTVELNPEAVIIQRGPNSAVMEQSAEGQSVQPVEPGTRVERNPQRVIIQRGSDSGEFVSSAVYLASADGKRPLRELFLSKSQDIPYLDWSPDNSRIAFLTQSIEDQSVELNLVNAQDGARPRKLVGGASAFWSWNPDGKTMITKVGIPGSPDKLSLFDTNTDQTTRIPSIEQLAFQAPHFSPDGGYMLITEKSGESDSTFGKHKLILADRTGQPQKTLTEFEGLISFAWSPAGAKVAYVVQSNDQVPGGPLTVLDVNTGEKKVVSNKPVMAFFWSPDGQRIASFSRANTTDIQPDFKGFDFTPPMSAPTMLLETINPTTGAARSLFYFAPTPAFQRLAAEFDRFSRSVNIWSPDSRKMVFTLTYGNTSGSRDYVLETEASGSINPRVIGNGSLAFWSPR